MVVKAIQTKIFREREPLIPFLLKNIRTLEEGDIVAITSKIVALSQGRVAKADNKETIIKKESVKLVAGPWCYLTLKDGEWCANAGVDESNAAGGIILLPRRPEKVARTLLTMLKKKFKIKKCGVILTDTRSIPLRQGTLGVALAWAGFAGIKSYIGRKDIFGRVFKVSRTNVADALAAAAVLAMGEGQERRPLAIIRGSEITFNAKSYHHRILSIAPKKDLYRPLFNKV